MSRPRLLHKISHSSFLASLLSLRPAFPRADRTFRVTESTATTWWTVDSVEGPSLTHLSTSWWGFCWYLGGVSSVFQHPRCSTSTSGLPFSLRPPPHAISTPSRTSEGFTIQGKTCKNPIEISWLHAYSTRTPPSSRSTKIAKSTKMAVS